MKKMDIVIAPANCDHTSNCKHFQEVVLAQTALAINGVQIVKRAKPKDRTAVVHGDYNRVREILGNAEVFMAPAIKDPV